MQVQKYSLKLNIELFQGPMPDDLEILCSFLIKSFQVPASFFKVLMLGGFLYESLFLIGSHISKDCMLSGNMILYVL